MKTSFLRRAGALLLSLALACSLLTLPASADDTTTPPAAVTVDSVTVTPSSEQLEISQTVKLSATVVPNPSNGSISQNVTWGSGNTAVATVGNDGTVTAVAPGTATITATSDVDPTKSGTCNITVKTPASSNIPVSSISVSPSSSSLDVGKTQQLTATVLPANAAEKGVRWVSANTRIATVDADTGLVTAVSEGDTMITALAKDASGKFGTCSITVTVPPADVSAITLIPEADTVSPGASITIKAQVTPENAADKTLTWESSNPKLSIVANSNTQSATLNVPANTPLGTMTTITATSNSVRGYCAIQVVAPNPPGIKEVVINSPTTNEFKFVDPNSTFKLTATAYPQDATESDRRILWKSDNDAVATVSSDGTVRGISPGEATITAYSAGDDSIFASRAIEVSGILLSYIKKSPTGGQGQTIQLSPSSTPVEIPQYRDILVNYQVFGHAKLKIINWESTNNTVAQVISGRVTANFPGENVTISANVAGTSYTNSFKVQVVEDVAEAISVSMGANPTYSFSNLLSTLNSRSQSKAGAPLESVYNLKVSTKNGILYYNYSYPESPGHGVGGTERFYYQPSAQGQLALKDVTFVPVAGLSGTAIVDYNAAATNGTTFTGTIRIEATSSGDVSYSTAADTPVTFSAEHFSAVCKSRTGRAISYVNFDQPSSSRGTLYQDYSPVGLYSPKVNNATRYYATSRPTINQVTFVPAAGFQGDVDIPYRCTDSSGASFTGVVAVRVSAPNGTQNGNVEYSVAINQRRSLNGEDFNDACQRATRANLNYIRFDSLPSSSAGTLYLDYSSGSNSGTRVTTSRNYYRNTSPRISYITFVPASGYSGTVTIPFTGTNTSGTTFGGNLIIHVGDGTGTVHYNTPRNQSVSFSAYDFNDACRWANGTTLNYIRFTSLPSSSTGTLYYGGTSGTRVTTGTDYRRNGSPALSSITFVPATGYTGTVSIPFTGYDTNGSRFDGTVTIAVGTGSGQLVSYSVTAGGAVRFNASDFNNACRSATGDTLNYIRFDASTTSYGSLYYQYNTSSRTGTAVSTGYGYYYSGSGRLLNDVTFAASSAGTAAIGYTGYSTRGTSFSGTVEVRVNAAATASFTGIRYTGSSAPVAFRAADFQNACQASLGTTLSSVQFTALPGVGRLYQNYSGPARTGTGVSSASRYSVQDLSQISYLPKAEYQGQITIPYTAYDTSGGTHSGTVEIQLSNSYCTSSFSDVAYGWDWAKPSIEFLRQSGITNGYSNSTFRPGQPISRGEFTLMVCRAFQFSTTGNSGFPDVPANSVYAGAIASARDLGIVQGNNGRFQPDRPITRQSAMTMICRAMDAAGQPVPSASTSLLSSYRDGGQVSAHARSSVAALVQLGAVRGTQDMRLNPGANISRAEMAVILHRVLAQ